MNTGELPQYFVQDTHEAIIDMDTFEQVQKKLAQNKERWDGFLIITQAGSTLSR
ncbi:MAG: recombinase family protein [Ruminococcus sp.]